MISSAVLASSRKPSILLRLYLEHKCGIHAYELLGSRSLDRAKRLASSDIGVSGTLETSSNVFPYVVGKMRAVGDEEEEEQSP